MSVLRNSSLRCGVAGVLAVMLSMSARATIVIDASVGHFRPGVVGRVVVHSMVPATSYSVARSRSWMRYRNNDRRTGNQLVVTPLAGVWGSSSVSQATARTHVARAQAYRLGRGE